MSGPAWTPDELQRVRAFYPIKSWPVLLREFPGRTKAGIRCKVIELDIRKLKNSRTPWTTPEKMKLREMYHNALWADICAALPRHPQGSIAKMASAMKLKRDGAKKKSRYRLIRELRAMRRERGVTRVSLATAIGTHPVQISKWERGETHPRIASLFDWVEALGCRLEVVKA